MLQKIYYIRLKKFKDSKDENIFQEIEKELNENI